MRLLILIVFLLGCNVNGQNTDAESKKDQEFNKLLQESRTVKEQAAQAAVKADQQTTPDREQGGQYDNVSEGRG